MANDSGVAPSKSLMVICPICRARHLWSTNNLFRPFCSAQCKERDLNSWASGLYVVPDNAPEITPPLTQTQFY